MQYLLTFTTSADRNAFAEKCGLSVADSTDIYIPLSLLQVAKQDESVTDILMEVNLN